MADDKNFNKNQQQTEATKNAALNAAKMYGGPLGVGVNLASKTKLGNAVLNKGAEALNKQNPALGKLTSAMNRGNSDLINNKNKSDLGSSADAGLPKDGLEDKGSIKAGSKKSRKNPFGLGKKDDNLDIDDSNGIGGDFTTQALKFARKHWTKILPIFGGFLLFLILIISIYVIVASIGGGVGQFFSNIGDAIIGFFDQSEQEAVEDYYKELDKVKKNTYSRKGVCIDENLITATLTVDIDASDYIEKGLEEAPADTENLVDTEDPDYYDDDNQVVTQYNKMKKQVGLLANMQIKTIVFGNDKTLHYAGGMCKPENTGTETELVTEENESRLKLTLLDKITAAQTNGVISTNPNLVSQHDVSGFWQFFKKKVNEETNYEYYIYMPEAELECPVDGYDEGNCPAALVPRCHDTVPSDAYQLSIGELNTMEDSVYYWNLVNSFIPNYYDEYLPEAEGAERDAAIKKIAEDIYLLYKDLGPGTTCQPDYVNQNYNYACINAEGQAANNIKVELLQCNDGTRFSPIEGESLVDLETYVTGVVYAENGGSSNYEALKAQAVAARTYLLRNNDGKDILTDGTTILKIRNCTERQVYCDPANGCWSDSKSAGKTVHSGQLSGKAYSKVPLPDSSKVYQAVSETLGEVVYDTDGKLISSGYKSSDQNRWNSMKGSDYLAMLSTSYSNLGTLASECIGTPGDWSNWKQANSPWSKLYIGNKTIGQVGCLMTSVAIQIARSGVYTTLGANFDPGTFMEAHKANGGFSGNSFNWDVTGVAPNFKYDGKIDANNSNAASKIADYINQGYYVILNLHHPGEHHVAVDRVEGGNIYMFDPGNYGTEVFSASWGGKLTIDSFSLYKVE